MKAAIAISENHSSASISDKFARSPFFLLINSNSSQPEVIANPCASISKMAGRCVAETLIDTYEIDTFIAFELGWKLLQIIQKKGLQIILLDDKTKTADKILGYLNIY